MDVTRRAMVGAALLASAGTALAFGKRVEQSQAPLERLHAPGGPIPIAFLLDQGATMIDFAGPWEAFQDVGAANSGLPGFVLYTVSPNADEVQTTGYMLENCDGSHNMQACMRGMRVKPDYAFTNAPAPKVVVIGAQANSSLPAKLEWIHQIAEHADVVMTVCTGAFILARTGLLDGMSATTHHNFYDQFAAAFPRVQLVRNRRYVDNGKLITAGGLTSGVDAALHVIARYHGADAAERTAANMEYHSDGWRTGVQTVDMRA